MCLCGCPDSEHEADECGEGCGRDDHECIRVAPAVLEIVQRYRVALSDALRAQPAPPPSDEVREAAEAVLAEAREALDEIRRRSTDKLAGGIAASFLGAHPRAALRGGQKGEGR